MAHDGMQHDGWCDECDERTVVVDHDAATGDAWATCTECGAGWVHRDDAPVAVTASRVPERRAA